MFLTARRLAAVGAAAFVCAATVQSQERGTDARSRAALDDMRAAYQALEAFHIKVNWTARYTGSMSADDFPLPGPDVLELRLQRPNKLFMSATSKRGGKSSSYLVVSDGTSLWYWRSGTNTYTQTKAPATLTAMPQALPSDAIGTMDGNAWAADSILEWDLLTGAADPVTEFMASGGAISVTGPEKLGDAQVTVVRMKTPDGAPITFENRLSLDVENHLVRGWNLAARGKNEDTGKDFSVAMLAVYEALATRPQFGATDFTFAPPAGARRVGGGTISSAPR